MCIGVNFESYTCIFFNFTCIYNFVDDSSNFQTKYDNSDPVLGESKDIIHWTYLHSKLNSFYSLWKQYKNPATVEHLSFSVFLL